MVKRNPERTRKRILDAATTEFSAHGLSGARVDAIADRAKANKRLIYHYFNSKEDLFLAVLERMYEEIRGFERELHLPEAEPEDAMRRLVVGTFDYYIGNPQLIALLNNENLHRAEHVKKSLRIKALHSPLVDQIRGILEAGEGKGVFRGGVDPVHLYISIAGIGYFYLSNIFTLSAIFDRDLHAKDALESRRQHVVDVIMGYLKPSNGVAAGA